MQESGLAVAEIAARVGYDDPYYFSRLFRRHTGDSPALIAAISGSIQVDDTQPDGMKKSRRLFAPGSLIALNLPRIGFDGLYGWETLRRRNSLPAAPLDSGTVMVMSSGAVPLSLTMTGVTSFQVLRSLLHCPTWVVSFCESSLRL